MEFSEVLAREIESLSGEVGCTANMGEFLASKIKVIWPTEVRCWPMEARSPTNGSLQKCSQ